MCEDLLSALDGGESRFPKPRAVIRSPGRKPRVGRCCFRTRRSSGEASAKQKHAAATRTAISIDRFIAVEKKFDELLVWHFLRNLGSDEQCEECVVACGCLQHLEEQTMR